MVTSRVSTHNTFVGLADQVAIEEQKDSGGVWKVSKSYAYGASGENLSLVDTAVNASTSKKSFYGTNPHGDTETLTDAATGQTTSTYRYTAYGQADKVGTTGDDVIFDNDPAKNADIVNPYRFNGSRYDGATGTYDMGFREYNPGLNRFLSRDMFDGALQDIGLGTDPWNANRYLFGGGNPISRVELDGHINAAEDGASGGGTIAPGSIPPPVEPQVPETKPTEPSTVEKVARWFAPGQFGKNVTEEVVVKPVQETYQACKAAIQMQNYQTNWQTCKTGTVLTGLGFTGGGKVLGIGVRTAEGLAAARAEAATARLLAARVFTSADPHVASAANAIEAAMPGRVVGVNSQIAMSNGLKREIDIDLGNLVVQVKSGNARGLAGQLVRTSATTGRTAIGYAPGIPNGAWEAAARQGIPIARSQDELLAIIGELG